MLWVRLKAPVDPLDGLPFVLLDDALVNVGVHLLVHEVPQFREVIIWEGKHKIGKVVEFWIRIEKFIFSQYWVKVSDCDNREIGIVIVYYVIILICHDDDHTHTQH